MSKQESPEPEKEHSLVANELRVELQKLPLTVVIFGASGHLARTKTYPALYELYEQNVFPPTLQIVGFARSKLDHDTFLKRISEKLKGNKVKQFLATCSYFSGKGYDDEGSYVSFAKHLADLEGKIMSNTNNNVNYDKKSTNRLCYFALPPGTFVEVAKNISKFMSSTGSGWFRVIVEKPFGKDLESCQSLISSMGQYLDEKVQYRIDHYLAKEMVQNILVLRFGNTIWDTIWDRRSIKCIKITMKESDGVAGRGGYYDEYGVIRDVFQNHLMQVLTLIAMEAPVSLDAEDVRDEKVKVLKAIRPPKTKDIIVGQYSRSLDGKLEGYREDESIKKLNPNSKQLTFLQTVLFVNNKRWAGVPFICKCGKGLDERKGEIRIQFRNDEETLFPNSRANELVIKIQPGEAIWLKMNTKKPGFARFDTSYDNELDVTYKKKFENLKLPGAYTRLLLDSLIGDQSLFVRKDELLQSWRICTPILKLVEKPEYKVDLYPRTSRGPPEADKQSINFGYEFSRKTLKKWNNFTRQVSSTNINKL